MMNPILLQKQLRDNATDLQEYYKDLKEWGSPWDEKKQRRENPMKLVPNNKVRKIDKPRKKSINKEIVKKASATKIGVTDYAAWEKFDADAECEKLENDVYDDSELSDELSEKQDQALIEKEKGNKFVHQQKWDEAIKCYTKAIECYSFDPIFYANRALCYLKKDCCQEAEKDCTLSLKLDNTYVKAYQRRAAAREALKKFEEAEYDTLKVLELEPKNKESRITLERIKKQLGRAEKPPEQRPISKFTISRNGTMPSNKATATSFISTLKTDTTYLKKDVDTVKPVSIWPEQNDIILVKPINKPPHLRSKKPLKRIEITEVDGTKSETDITKLSEATDAIKKHVFEKRPVEQVLETPTKTFFNMKRSERNLDNLEHPTALPQPKQEVTCIRSDDLKIIEKNPPKEKRSDLNKNIVENKVLTSYNTTNNNFIVPQTSLQFCLTWKKLKNMEEKYKYLKCVPPHNLPQIFLASLENDIFSSILEVLVKHFIDNKDYVFDILDNLTRVKRFGALAAFMSTEDKANLWKLYDYMKQTEQKDMKELDKLKTKYELN